MQQTTPPQRAVRFTGRSFMAFVLTPQPPIADWLAKFDTFARRSPGFFAGRPIVVDISLMPPTRPDLVNMVTELKKRNIIIMGLDGRAPGELGADARGLPPILSGGKEIAAIAALGDGRPLDSRLLDGRLLDGRSALPAPMAAPHEAGNVIHLPVGGHDAKSPPSGDDAPAPSASGQTDSARAAESALASIVEAAIDPAVADVGDAAGPNETLIIDEPVRSGQSVVHLKGDVIVVGPVASGSEIVASGSIHIYGALRGRAIAGSTGNRQARIFASSLNAELVAIDGLYKTAEDLDRACIGRAIQVWLDGDALRMAAFNGKGS